MTTIKRNFRVRPSIRRRITEHAAATQCSVGEVLRDLLDPVLDGTTPPPEIEPTETRSELIPLWDTGEYSVRLTKLARQLGVSTNDIIEALILTELPPKENT